MQVLSIRLQFHSHSNLRSSPQIPGAMDAVPGGLLAEFLDFHYDQNFNTLESSGTGESTWDVGDIFDRQVFPSSTYYLRS